MPETIYFPTRREWREWLQKNHQTEPGVWVIFYKKNSGQPTMTYDESVEEALCFGWIDSVANKIDEVSFKQLFSPRKPKSGWSRPNKIRIERLIAEGQMAEVGLAKIEAAKIDGSWTKLDAVEELLIPDDLQMAFDTHPPASENFGAFPRSTKRAILEWLTNAKRPETRAKRIDDIATKAAKNKRAIFDKD